MSECHLEINYKTLENAWYMATNHSGSRKQFKEFMTELAVDEYAAGFHAGRIDALGECVEVPIDEVEDE